MSGTRRSRRWPAAVLAVAGALAFAGLGAVAYASIPDSGGVIHGCYKTNKGDLRVIDPSAGNSCQSSETSLDWSQTGPQGATGPQGPQGPPGPEGSGHAFVATGSTTITHGLDEVMRLDGLPAGKYLVWAPVIVVGDGDTGTNDVCEWKINDSQIVVPEGDTFMFDAKDDAFGRADMSDALTLTTDNSSISVLCDTNEHGADAHGQITALKVGAIN